MVDLDLRPGRRQAVLEQITRALAHATKGSEVGLRGSLAVGAADAYSDIDLCWVVPDVQFETAVASVGYALARVERVVSLRLDPDYARSDRRRLIFARLAGMPLFWRVDLDIRAASVAPRTTATTTTTPGLAARRAGPERRAPSRTRSAPSRPSCAISPRLLKGRCSGATNVLDIRFDPTERRRRRSSRWPEPVPPRSHASGTWPSRCTR